MERIHRELLIFFFKVKAEIFFKKLPKNQISRFWIKGNTQHPLMIVIICAKYKKNPPRTVDATERTRFSKSRPNDLEDIGQGQGSSHATPPLMLSIICTKYGKNPSWTVDATERMRDGWTDRRTDGQTDGWSETNIPPNNFVVWGVKQQLRCVGVIITICTVKKNSFVCSLGCYFLDYFTQCFITQEMTAK